MKITGILSRINLKVAFVLFLFVLASIEPPFSLPFIFPRTTWGVMKLGLLLIFLYSLLEIWVGEKDYFHKRKEVFLAPLFFLIANILSIINAADMSASMSMLLFLLISLSFYFLAIYYFNKIRYLGYFLQIILFITIFSGIISLLMLVLFHFENLQFLGEFLVKIFPMEGTWRFIGDLQRRRLQTFWMVEFSFPVLLYFVFFSKRFFKLGLLGIVLSIIGIMLANNRYQFVTMVFGITMFLWLNRKIILRNKKIIKVFFGSFLVVIIAAVFLSNYFLGKNLFQRFLLLDYQRDVETITGRFYLFDQAWKMFLSSPIVGLGLRNFSFYLSPEGKMFTDPLWKLHEIAYYPHFEPHNVFFQAIAETGIIGLAAFLLLIFTFLKQDILLYGQTKEKLTKIIFLTISLSSWCYIVDEQLTFINDSLMAQTYFWFSRGLLAAFYLKLQPAKEYLPKKKRKIMFVVHQWASFGGVEKEIIQLSSKLKKYIDSSIFSLDKERRWHPKIFLSLWRRILKEKPNALVSFCDYSNLVSGLTVLFNMIPVKLIFAEYNNPTAMLAPQKFKWIKKRLIWFFYNLVAIKVIAVSKSVRGDLIKNFGINKNKIETIYTTVDIEKVNRLLNKKITFPDGVKKGEYIVAVGRLSPEKRFDYLINVFAELVRINKKFQLVILGEGREKEALTKKINQLNLEDNIHLLGAKDNPFPYIKNAKVLVLTSEAEGFSRVILEAMACGTPVISTNFYGVKEIVEDEKTGLIVGMNNKQELKEAIQELSSNYQLRRKMGLEAKKKVSLFDPRRSINAYLEIFKTL